MSSHNLSVRPARRALVVFEDRDDARLLRLLRPGFRHCFCLTGEGLRWTLCDPLKSRLAVASVDGASAAELARHLAAEGRAILYGIVGEPAPGGPPGLRPLTCVEIVKRLLGVSASGVLTPHQLYRSLLTPEPGRPAFVPLAGRA
jgi:hypothetical protein